MLARIARAGPAGVDLAVARLPARRLCWLSVWSQLGMVCGASAQGLVINEVLYDPQGADSGQEFVELYHAGPSYEALTGVRLEFANGADGPQWQVRWEATPADTIAPGALFLIGDTGWSAEEPAQAVTDLDLQNGPDAIRLVRGGTTLDLVGYGDLTDPALFESQAAHDVTSGFALARKPDGHDTDANQSDFVAAEPTPGRLNFALHALRVVAVSCEPPSATRPGCGVQLEAVIAGAGLAPLGPSPVRITAGSVSVTATLPVIAPEAEDTLGVRFVATEAGRLPLALVVPLPGASDSLRLDLGHYCVGPAILRLSEVMAAPSDGGEWIELIAADAGPVPLARYRVRDADGDWRALPPVELPASQRALLVQDLPAFRTCWEAKWAAAGIEPCLVGLAWDRVWELAGWPALNNEAPERRSYADRVLLADSCGVVDHVTVGAGTAPGDGSVTSGRSLERLAAIAAGREEANWALCALTLGGTPGCANSVAAPTAAVTDLKLAPNPFSPGGAGEVLHVRFQLAVGHAAWSVQVYDLWGQRVRDLGGDALGAGPREVIWDGRADDGKPVPAGGYIVLLSLQDTAGRLVGGAKRLVALNAAAVR